MSTLARPGHSPSGDLIPTMIESDQGRDIEDLTDRLSDRFDDAIPRETISTRVRRQFAVFQHVAIRQFVPVFVERRVRAELDS